MCLKVVCYISSQVSGKRQHTVYMQHTEQIKAEACNMEMFKEKEEVSCIIFTLTLQTKSLAIQVK